MPLQSILDSQAQKAKQWFDRQLELVSLRYPTREGVDAKIAIGEETAVRQLNEFFEKERVFMSNMDKISEVLSSPEVQESIKKLPTDQQHMIKEYRQNLDALLTSYQNLDLHKLISDQNVNPAEVISDLRGKMASKDFSDYTANITKLSLAYTDLLTIKNEKFTKLVNEESGKFPDKLPFQARAVNPVQHIMRYPLQWESITRTLDKIAENAPLIEPAESSGRSSFSSVDSYFSVSLADSIDDAKSALTRSKEIAGEADKAQEVKAKTEEVRMKANEECKHNDSSSMLRKVLDLNLNSPAQKKTDEAKYAETYLKTILLNSFSKYFKLDKSSGELIVRKNSEEIRAAFGLKSGEKFVIDPARFNAEKLDALYKKDKNPLWHVLKSTKPIDETFTAQQKIQAYQEVAKDFQSKKIGRHEKYMGAYHLAQAANAVAKEHPECHDLARNVFAEDTQIGQWIIKKHQIYKKDTEAVKGELRALMSDTSSASVEADDLAGATIRTAREYMQELRNAEVHDKEKLDEDDGDAPLLDSK